MAVNRGKQFEDAIKNAFNKEPNTIIYRLQDSMGGFSGVANICDFIVYQYPIIHFIECKSCHGNTWNFKNLTDTQYRGLVGVNKAYGVNAGVMLWFVDRDVTFYVPIEEIKRRIEKGDKSIRFTDDYFVIDGKKKRVLFEYNMSKYLKTRGE